MPYYGLIINLGMVLMNITSRKLLFLFGKHLIAIPPLKGGETMKKVDVAEMRTVEGGIWWGWVAPWTKACAIARLYYEHATAGYCYTRYGFVSCPVCGKN